jgi:hypothetical protein
MTLALYHLVKPLQVRAIRWDGVTSYPDVSYATVRWANYDDNPDYISDDRIAIGLVRGIAIKAGDWVIEHCDADSEEIVSCSVLSNEQFLATYTPVLDEVPAVALSHTETMVERIKAAAEAAAAAEVGPVVVPSAAPILPPLPDVVLPGETASDMAANPG